MNTKQLIEESTNFNRIYIDEPTKLHRYYEQCKENADLVDVGLITLEEAIKDIQSKF